MSSTLKTMCPHCTSPLRVREDRIGQTVRCPRCQKPFEVTSVRSASDTSIALTTSVETIARENTIIEDSSGSDLRRADSEPNIGQFGRYELKQVLGQGGFGRVYRAYDPQLDRWVALKVPTVAAMESAQLQRFLKEGRLAARLRHPHIVSVFDSGEVNGQPYLATEFVPGRSLSDVIKEQKPDIRQAVVWVKQIAEALAYAHEQNVVHRDVKPHNVMVDERNRTQLMDFGLAQRTDADSSMTTEGSILGTPAYMAPEQARGQISAVGPHSDQYSLGVILYELLTGKKPFTGPPHVVVMKVASLKVLPPAPTHVDPAIPPPLEAICLRAMQKDSSLRYPDCMALVRDLDKYLAGEFDSWEASPPTASSSPRSRPVWQSPWAFGGAAAIACLSMFLVFRSRPESPVTTAHSPAPSPAITQDVVPATTSPPALPSAMPSGPVAASSSTDIPPIDWSRTEIVKLRESPPIDGKIIKLCVTSDGSRAIVSADNQLRLLDTESMELVFEFPPSQGVRARAMGVALSPDPKIGAIQRLHPGGIRGQPPRSDLELWSLESSPRLLKRLETLTGGYHPDGLAFSQDGSRVAAAAGRVVRAWNIETGTSLPDAETGVSGGSLRYCSDGTLIAAGGYPARRIDPEGKILTDYLLPSGQYVNSLALSRDERRVLLGGDDGRIGIFDRMTGELLHNITAHQTPARFLQPLPDGRQVRSLETLPDGRHVLTTDNNRTLVVFDIETGSEVFRHQFPDYSAGRVTMFPDGVTFLASRFWRENHIAAMTLPDDERQLYDATPETISVYRLQSRPEQPPVAATPSTSPLGADWNQVELGQVAESEVFGGPESHFRDIAVTPDGTRAIIAGTGRTCLLDTATGRTLFEFPRTDGWGAAISPDGETALILTPKPGSFGKPDETMILMFWELNGPLPRLRKALPEVCGRTFPTLKYSPDGKYFALRDSKGKLRKWEVAKTFEVERQNLPLAESTGALAFCADNSLITAGKNEVVQIGPEGNIERTYENKRSIHALLPVAGDRQILVGGDGGDLTVYDRETGKLVRELPASAEAIKSLSLFPDRRHAIVTDGRTLRILDTETWEEVFRQEAPDYSFGVSAVLPDGHSLVVGPASREHRAEKTPAEEDAHRLWTTTPMKMSVYRFRPRQSPPPKAISQR